MTICHFYPPEAAKDIPASTVSVRRSRLRWMAAGSPKGEGGMSDREELNSTLVIALLVGLGVHYAWPSDTVSAYEKVCQGTELLFPDCAANTKEAILYLKTEFRVDFASQRVFELGAFVNQLENCTVFNTENWRCAGATTSTAMNNGSVYRYGSPGLTYMPTNWLSYSVWRLRQ